jgi:hypothetical protein
MYVRCAYFEGSVDSADRERFESLVREQIAPQMLQFPGIRKLRLLWGQEYETLDRNIYLVLEHGYDSLQDIQVAITSDVRAGMQSALDELLSLFHGNIYHVNYEIETPALPPEGH